MTQKPPLKKVHIHYTKLGKPPEPNQPGWMVDLITHQTNEVVEHYEDFLNKDDAIEFADSQWKSRPEVHSHTYHLDHIEIIKPELEPA